MWRAAWRWLVAHLRTADDDWKEVTVVHESEPGISPVSVRAKCPFCKNGMRNHRAFASEPEGDLIQCAAEWDHWWVRSAATRQEERDEHA